MTEDEKKLVAGITAVVDLMNESIGVDGLHRNGDVASWDELRTGGRFECWLMAFDDALEVAGRLLKVDAD